VGVIKYGGNGRWLVSESPPMKENDRLKVITVSEENTTNCGRKEWMEGVEAGKIEFQWKTFKGVIWRRKKKRCFVFLFLFL